MLLSPVAAALALCALCLPISIAASNIALGLLTLALLLRARADGARMKAAWRREPALAALAVYGAAGMLAAFFSPDPAASLQDALKDWHRFWSLGLFVAALALEPETPVQSALALAFVTVALYGISQTAFGGRPYGKMIRGHAFVHPVVFGEQMALALLGGACAFLAPTPRVTRKIATFFVSLFFLALVLNQTRMALLAAAGGFGLLVLLEPRARRWAIPAALAVAAVGLMWELFPSGGRGLSSAMSAYDPQNPQQARWALWDVALRIFKDHPLLGAGPGGYRRLFTAYHPGLVDNLNDWASAHNLYLHQLAERGVVGGAALLALCAALQIRALKAARKNAGFRSLWAAASIFAFLLMCVTETAFQNEQFSALLLLIWAWGTASLRSSAEIL
jgi:O-antigen ligase